ncbi:MAG: AAA family ATPase [Syntrophaceae bacterium]|nr:AAA family ATPase [Syntrophaceae bacterium]
MTNPFSISNESLKTLLDGFTSWVNSNELEKSYAPKEREKSKQLKETLLNHEYLAATSDDVLINSILSYSKTLEGPAKIKIGIPRVTDQINDLRRNLNYLSDSHDDPFSKAEKILDGEYKIPIFAKAFWTPLFQAQYPNLLPNWNNKTEKFFNMIGIIPKKSKLSIKDKYKKISEAFSYLQEVDPTQDFFTLDHLMHYGVSIEEGINLINIIASPSIPIPQPKPTPSNKLCLIGTSGSLDDIQNAEDFIRDHGNWASWWSFPIKDRAKELLMSPFHLYINSGGGTFPYRLTVKDYQTSKGNKGIPSPWPEITEGKYTGKTKDGNTKSDIFKTWLKINEIKKIDPPLKKKDFTPVPGLSKETNLLNQNTFGYAYALEGTLPIRVPLTIAWLEAQTLLDRTELEEIIDAIKNSSPQIIFAGPPGTSKTWIAERIARYITQDEPDATTFVQFHPTYGYEAFIEGLRPIVKEGGGINFEREDGLVLSVVKRMKDNNHLHINSPLYVVIIDEMNRANLPKVFGELMYLFEYRDHPIHLQYSKEFTLPPNLRFIGTMNTADRSIRSIDLALRRRFDVFEFDPNPKILEAYFKAHTNKVNNLIDGFVKLNGDLTSYLDAHHTIGHAFFMIDGLDRKILNNIWRRKIKPLINEYFFDQPDIAEEFTFEKYWPGEIA